MTTILGKATIGELASGFQLEASDGRKVKLSEFRGQNVVLYFYPKDLTPACSNEACDFRDHSKEFASLNTVILGISPDPVERHQRFIEKYGLPFMLLSDEEHRVAELYGVWQLKKLYGHEHMGIARSTFFIDEKGVLIKEWRNVKVKNHVEKTLEFIRNM